jgi:hypothetical protein
MEAPDWKKLFEQAVLETNNEVLPQKLASAERALTARLRELNLDHGGTPEEQKQFAVRTESVGYFAERASGELASSHAHASNSRMDEVSVAISAFECRRLTPAASAEFSSPQSA